MILSIGLTKPEVFHGSVDTARISTLSETSPSLLTTTSEQEVNPFLYSDERFDIAISEVRLTNYYANDGYGSGRCTSSGKCINDFEVNSKGWYTYNGYVVVAASTYRCLSARSGACGRIRSIPNGFNIHQHYEILTISVDDQNYEAIVLDSCGACMFKINGEQVQRYDIFTINPRSRGFIKPPRYGQLIQMIKQEQNPIE